MTARLVTSVQVRALAEQVRAVNPEWRAMIVRARPVWTEPTDLQLSTGAAKVVPAISPLAVREALAQREGDEFVVVLTEVSDRELGADVLARVAKARVIVPQSWDLLRTRLSLSLVDPALGAHPWMADALLQYEPPNGWAPPAGGLLGLDLAWSLLCEHWLRITPDGRLASLMEWISRAGAVDSLLKAPEPIRDGALDMLRERHSHPGHLALTVAVAGRPGDVVALGLAARAVFSVGRASELVEARVHFALDVGQRSVEPLVANAWADAAEEVVRDRLDKDGRVAVDPWLERAEQLAHSFGADSALGESALLPAGLEQRYARAASLVQVAAGGDQVALASLDSATTKVAEHALAGLEAERLEGLRAAVRLARRLAADSVEPAEHFTAAAAFHRRDSSWCDRARHTVRVGDRNPTVSAAYTALLAATDALRETENQRFATLLAQWSATEPMPNPALVPVENLLAEVIAPLAQLSPVMLVVLDGMSWAVATELLASVTAQGWLTVQPEGAALPNAIAMLPTVTNVSRASLLCGKRVVCDAAGEKAGFISTPALNGLRPVLFHKGDLSTADGRVLGADVQAALADTTRRVVGVVVNAIDDHLGRGDQVKVKWDLDHVTPLRELLTIAGAVGRTVVFTSDHGHVLDERGRTQYRQIPDAAERWRPAYPVAADGELVVKGPRVMTGGGEVVMPWTEALRYGTPKHGYHGGATPQEALVPLVVLARATAMPVGWERADEEPPAWWRLGAPAPARPVPMLAPTLAPVAAPAKHGQSGLFDDVPVVAAPPTVAGRPAWIDALLRAPLYVSRKSLIARAQVDDTMVATVLVALDRAGGSILREALAGEVAVPLFRVDGLIQSLRRLLNVEGYAVIELDNDTVRLHRDTLRAQFEVTG